MPPPWVRPHASPGASLARRAGHGPAGKRIPHCASLRHTPRQQQPGRHALQRPQCIGVAWQGRMGRGGDVHANILWRVFGLGLGGLFAHDVILFGWCGWVVTQLANPAREVWRLGQAQMIREIMLRSKITSCSGTLSPMKSTMSVGRASLPHP